jgi:hypothetical protein
MPAKRRVVPRIAWRSAPRASLPLPCHPQMMALPDKRCAASDWVAVSWSSTSSFGHTGPAMDPCCTMRATASSPQAHRIVTVVASGFIPAGMRPVGPLCMCDPRHVQWRRRCLAVPTALADRAATAAIRVYGRQQPSRNNAAALFRTSPICILMMPCAAPSRPIRRLVIGCTSRDRAT